MFSHFLLKIKRFFPPGEKIASCRNESVFSFSFSLCFHFPSRDVILGLVHDRVSPSFESIIVEVYIYIIIIINNRDVIFYYSDFSRDSKLHKHRISS